MGWIWGVVLSIIIYTLLNHLFPAAEAMIPSPVLAEYDEADSAGGNSSEDLSEKDKVAAMESN